MKKMTFGAAMVAVLMATGITSANAAPVGENPPKDPTKIVSVTMPGKCNINDLSMQVIWQHKWIVTPAPASPNYFGNRVYMARIAYNNPRNNKSKQYKYPQLQSITYSIFWDKPGLPAHVKNRRDLWGTIFSVGGALNSGSYTAYPQDTEDNTIPTDVLNAIRWVPSTLAPSVQMKASREMMGRKGKYTETVYCESYADGRRVNAVSKPQPGPHK